MDFHFLDFSKDNNQKQKRRVLFEGAERRSPNDIAHYIKELAKSHSLVRRSSASERRNFKHHFAILSKQIIEGCKRLEKQDEILLPRVTAEQWIIENRSMIFRSLEEVEKGLLTPLFSRLPFLCVNSGHARVYDIVVWLLENTSSAFTLSRLTTFLQLYQRSIPLEIGEIWALPLVIKTILLEELALLTHEIVSNKLVQRQVISAIQKLTVYRQEKRSASLMFDLLFKKDTNLTVQFVLNFLDAVKDKELHAFFLERLSTTFLNSTPNSLRETINLERAKQVKNERIIRNIVLSLHNISQIDWSQFVEKVSLLEEALQNDPAGIYPKMDVQTRDLYRHVVEEVALSSGFSQLEIARWVVTIAKKKSLSLDEALFPNHVGYYLLGSGRADLDQAFPTGADFRGKIFKFIRDYATRFYIGSIILGGAGLELIEVLFINNFSPIGIPNGLLAVLIVLLMLPNFYLLEQLVNALINTLFRPQFLPRMDFERGVPIELRTMVVLPTILFDSSGECEELLKSIEMNYLANQDSNIFFALLLAFPETDAMDPLPTEKEKNRFKDLLQGLESLNKKYPNNGLPFFHVFLRERCWNAAENCCMEWERKRGKLLEFNQLLQGSKQTSFVFCSAEENFLSSIKYVITIDRDVFLPKESAKKLIATITHPLNHAVVDQKSRKVVSGYGIIQPRLSPTTTGTTSLMNEWLGERGGWDSYAGTVSNVYQDFFQESIYMGKGIYKVDIANQVLSKRFPNNILLSHDHLEGFYCRTGYASDIQVFEGYPMAFIPYIKRLHRWIRGDWQCLSWIFSRVRNEEEELVQNPLAMFQRWKLLWGTLSTLVLPAIFSLILFSWFLLLGKAGWFLTLFSVGILGIQPFFSLVNSLPPISPKDLTWSFLYYNIKKIRANLWHFLMQLFLNVAFLGSQSLVVLNAVFKALIRLLATKKKRLEWVTFHEQHFGLTESFFSNLSQTKNMVFLCLVFLILLLRQETAMPILTTTVLSTWFLSPLTAFLVSKPSKPQLKSNLSENKRRYLRGLSRKTWGFFEDLVTPENHWLPPDSLQQGTVGSLISDRTSTTNIGVYLLTALSALDLGFMGPLQFVSSSKRTLSMLKKLKRYRGHFFNWYNLKTLDVLSPAYISTVDSGNLIGSLIAFKEGLGELPARSIYDKEIISDWRSLMSFLQQEVPVKFLFTLKAELPWLFSPKEPFPTLLRDWFSTLKALKDWQNDFGSKILAQTKPSFWFMKFSKKIDDSLTELIFLAPWLGTLFDNRGKVDEDYCKELTEFSASLSLVELQSHYHDFLKNITGVNLNLGGLELKKDDDSKRRFVCQLSKQVEDGLDNLETLLKEVNELIYLVEGLTEEVDFSFLYNKEKNLFHVGYNLSKKRFDRYHYDLFLSEARLASFLAVTKSNVPIRHWASLQRPVTFFRGELSLLSWAGSLYETISPFFLMPVFPGTLLDATVKTVIKGQMAFGAQKGIPWGFSESSDRFGRYQYRMHGVPFLGLRGEVAKSSVVAPYATFQALPFVPDLAFKNILRLEQAGASGHYGFFEALDYNSSSRKDPKPYVMRLFLCHHQGLSLIGLATFLLGPLVERRFCKDLGIKGGLFLLEEYPSAAISPTKLFLVESESKKEENPAKEISLREETVLISDTKQMRGAPLMHLLSNGKYKVLISNRGSGYSGYGTLCLTSWREDPTFDDFGLFFYLKDLKSGKIWSPALQPLKKRLDDSRTTMSENFLKIEALAQKIKSELQVFVLPTEDVEVRRLRLTNNGATLRQLQITSYAEVVLNDYQSSLAHPSFSKMKILSEFDKENKALIFSRRGSGVEKYPFLVHKMVVNRALPSLTFETNRLDFIGRGRDLCNPYLIEFEGKPVGSTGFTLDPIMSFSCKVELKPFETIDLFYLVKVANTKEEALGGAIQASSFELQRLEKDLEQREKENDLGLDLESCQKLLSCLIYKRSKEVELKELGGSPALSWVSQWQEIQGRWGINNAAHLVTIKIEQRIPKRFLEDFMKCFFHLSQRGFEANCIILIPNQESVYFQFLKEQVQEIIDKYNDLFKFSASFVLIREEELTKEQLIALRFLSRLVLDTAHGSLKQQIETNFKQL